MIFTVSVPHIDVNEKTAVVSEVLVEVGQSVDTNTELAVVDSLKVAVSITPESSGYIRKILVKESDEVEVGRTMFILSDSMDELIDEDVFNAQSIKKDINSDSTKKDQVEVKKITAKAQSLAKEKGLDLANVQPVDGVISVQEIMNHLNKTWHSEESSPIEVPHNKRKLSNVEKGTLLTINWSKENAIPAYLETVIDISPLKKRAQQIKRENDWFFDPTFSLLAWLYVQYVAANNQLNSTCIENHIINYSQINLGFTVNVKGQIYMPVLHKADALCQINFVEAIINLQRKSIKNKLTPAELKGMTIGITSLAAFNITKHQPILPPYTSIMLAHSNSLPFDAHGHEYSILGVTYDHRIHNGASVSNLLQNISQQISNL
jgi:pyruvate/2-oxoglutarate dehydrogenase complex dihydrolipoamide acyltransferase (E2) component